MKISEDLHTNKVAIIRAVTDVFDRHGNGFDLMIKAHVLVVDITIRQFDKGRVITGRQFSVEPQAGREEDCYDLAKFMTEEALQSMGADFVTLGQAIKEAAND